MTNDRKNELKEVILYKLAGVIDSIGCNVETHDEDERAFIMMIAEKFAGSMERKVFKELRRKA